MPWQLSSLVQPAGPLHHPQHLVRRQLGEGPPLGVGVARVRQQGGGAQHVALQAEGGTGRTWPELKSSHGSQGSVRQQGGGTRQPAELSKQGHEAAVGKCAVLTIADRYAVHHNITHRANTGHLPLVCPAPLPGS